MYFLISVTVSTINKMLIFSLRLLHAQYFSRPLPHIHLCMTFINRIKSFKQISQIQLLDLFFKEYSKHYSNHQLNIVLCLEPYMARQSFYLLCDNSFL